MREDDAVDRILESLSLINVSLEHLKVSLAGTTEMAGDHENRIREIEQWKYRLSPLLTWIAFLFGAAFNVLASRLW